MREILAMSRELHELLLVHLNEMVRSISKKLKTSMAPHYQQINNSVLNGRVIELVSAFLESIKKDLIPLVTYIQKITEQRIVEGFFLSEIQLALGLLENHAWKIVIENISQDEKVKQLWKISSTIGAAKDQLAQIYLRHHERPEAATDRLQGKLDELFKGTDAPPLQDD